MNLLKRNGSFKTPRSFNLTLTIPGLTAWAIGLVVVLSSFFALGVVVGRSYRPKPVILTQPSDPEAGKVLAAPAETTANATGKNATALAKAETVLKPEELQYMERLKSRPEPQAPAPAAKAPDKPQPAAKNGAADKKAEAAKKDAAKKETPKKEAAPMAGSEKKDASKDQPAKKESASQDPDQQVYAYQYQVASFKKQEVAEEMRRKVAKLGLDTVVQAKPDNGQSWFRVVVRFTGKPEDTRGLKDKLATIGVTRTMLLSKRAK